MTAGAAGTTAAGLRPLHVVWEYPPVIYGGLARHAEHLTRAQAGTGLQVRVLTLAEDVTAPARRIAAGDGTRRGVLVRRVRRSRPRTSWLDLSVAAAEAETALAAAGHDWLSGPARPGVDVVHAHDWIGSQAAATIARAARVPLVLTVHATEWGRQQGRIDGNPVATRVHELERRAVASADVVLVCSAAMRDEVVEVLGADPGRVQITENAVDAASWRSSRPAADAARRRWLDDALPAPGAGSGDGPLVVSAGRLEWEKGFSTLVRAVPWLRDRFPQLRVVLAGRGSYADRLRQLACELEVLDAVAMPGWLPARELAVLYAACDAVVVPSRYEPSGLVAREAQAAGATVVATAVGGLADAVLPGRTGLQIGVGDVHGLERALARLIDDPVLASDLGRAGQAAVAGYSWHQAAIRTAGAYRFAARVAGESERPPSLNGHRV